MDYMAHYEKSPRMWSQGLHAHDFYEIYIHIKGARFYCIDNTIFELQPNQLLIIPPLHMHGLVCDHDLVDYERCYLYLSPEMLCQCGLGKVDLARLIDDAYKHKKLLRCLSSEEVSLCQNYLKLLEQTSASVLFQNQLDNYSKILQILEIMICSMEASSSSFHVSTVKSSMQDILHYINDHFTENITVSSIGQLFHLSESFLSHRFKEYTNKGIYEYILYKRILKAKELMGTDLSLTEIAFQCGFHDYSNFLRVFKKISRESPKDYRMRIFSHK